MTDKLFDIRKKYYYKFNWDTYVPPPLEEVLPIKLETTEKLFVKEIAKMVAVQAILAPRRGIKNRFELEQVIIEFLMSYQNGHLLNRLNPYSKFIEAVAEYIEDRRGHLNVKQFVYIDDNEEKKQQQQKKLDEVFWK